MREPSLRLLIVLSVMVPLLLFMASVGLARRQILFARFMTAPNGRPSRRLLITPSAASPV